MKILKRGQPERTRIWEGTCHHCKSDMSEAQSKLKIIYDQRDGPFTTAMCPVCGEDFHLYPSKEYYI